MSTEEKQARAEALRVAAAEMRSSRLAKAQADREAARQSAGERAEALLQQVSDRHSRSEALRQQVLAERVFKAGDEMRKVAEVLFINQLAAEDRKTALQQRLEEGEARRAERLAAAARAAEEVKRLGAEATERRRAMEAERLGQLADKQVRAAP